MTDFCSAYHWVGHSRVMGEDIFRLCELSDGHEGPHSDLYGGTWTDEHVRTSQGSETDG